MFSLYNEHQHFFILSSKLSYDTFKKVSYCPANDFSFPSSFDAEDRTETKSKPSSLNFDISILFLFNNL